MSSLISLEIPGNYVTEKKYGKMKEWYGKPVDFKLVIFLGLEIPCQIYS